MLLMDTLMIEFDTVFNMMDTIDAIESNDNSKNTPKMSASDIIADPAVLIRRTLEENVNVVKETFQNKTLNALDRVGKFRIRAYS